MTAVSGTVVVTVTLFAMLGGGLAVDQCHTVQRANCRTPRSPALVLYLRSKREQEARLWRMFVSSDAATESK